MNEPIKGWYVVALLDDAEEGSRPRQISSLYQTKATAEQFAEMARKQLKRPESVVIKTRAHREKTPIY